MIPILCGLTGIMTGIIAWYIVHTKNGFVGYLMLIPIMFSYTAGYMDGHGIPANMSYLEEGHVYIVRSAHDEHGYVIALMSEENHIPNAYKIPRNRYQAGHSTHVILKDNCLVPYGESK